MSQTSKFCVGDEVKIINSDGTRAGPYYISSIISVGVYTLSLLDGQEAFDGEGVEENDIEAV